MQAKRSSRGSNATQTRRIIIILNSNLVLCCIYRGLKLAYAETKRTDSCLMWKLRKDRRLENMSIFFYIRFVKTLARRHALFYFSFYFFCSQPIRARLPCAPFGSEGVSGRRLVISVRSALLSRTSKSTAQDTNTVRVCPVCVCLTQPREELFN